MTSVFLRASLALWKRREASREVKYRHAAVMTPKGSPERHKYHQLLVEARRMVAKRSRELEARQVKTVSAAGVKFIADFEGFYSHRYDDGVGVQTIGYGFIASDFPRGKFPTYMTKPEAQRVLRRLIDRNYTPPVRKALKRIHPTQNQLDAAVSFAFNLGTGAFTGSPGFETLTHALRYGTPKQIADAFLLYDNPNDPNVHAGLARRRRAERALFLKH